MIHPPELFWNRSILSTHTHTQNAYNRPVCVSSFLNSAYRACVFFMRLLFAAFSFFLVLCMLLSVFFPLCWCRLLFYWLKGRFIFFICIECQFYILYLSDFNVFVGCCWFWMYIYRFSLCLQFVQLDWCVYVAKIQHTITTAHYGQTTEKKLFFSSFDCLFSLSNRKHEYLNIDSEFFFSSLFKLAR